MFINSFANSYGYTAKNTTSCKNLMNKLISQRVCMASLQQLVNVASCQQTCCKSVHIIVLTSCNKSASEKPNFDRLVVT